MAKLVRGCLTARPQQAGAKEPERDPQQEDQPDAAEGKDIADYNLDIDCVGSVPEVEPVMQDERKVDPDAEYANMEIPHDGTIQWGSCGYIRHKDLRLWPQSSRICTPGLDLAPK